jgi:hypothetical protein
VTMVFGKMSEKKKLYLIGGTMGVGKTTACQILKTKLSNSVFLDGDWCWDSHPFVVTEETKRMVLDNICYLLNNFIRCSAYKNIVFCWVMHQQSIIDYILSRLDTSSCNVLAISLVCTPEALERRLRVDIESGLRAHDILARGMERLPLYNSLDTTKIDTSNLSPEEVAEKIASL